MDSLAIPLILLLMAVFVGQGLIVKKYTARGRLMLIVSTFALLGTFYVVILSTHIPSLLEGIPIDLDTLSLGPDS